jgi:hypothetical protein
MLYHHDSRDYNQAASEAAKAARTKIEALIERGRTNAADVINQVMAQVPVDRIVPATHLEFFHKDAALHVTIDGSEESVHDHALGQIVTRASMPMAFARTLQAGGEWGQDLLQYNLNRLYQESPASRKRYLTRTVVNGSRQLRGFLSDHYRRLDSRPLLEAFVAAAQSVGALPVEGYALDTKVALKALLPIVFEPVANEVIAFGIVWENSDFGNGAHSVRVFILRLWCTNFAIMCEVLRQIHVGKRIEADFEFSQKTHNLDTKAAASAMSDLAKGLLVPDEVHKHCELIKKAHEEQVSPAEVTKFLKKNLLKGEADEVIKSFNSPDIVNLPAGQNKWRLSNALSWVAGNMGDRERSLELMKLAGKVIG